MGEIRYTYKILVGKSEWTRALEDLGVNVRIILKLMSIKWGVMMWIEFVWYRIWIDATADSCEHGKNLQFL
jgi:hypothetical protein